MSHDSGSVFLLNPENTPFFRGEERKLRDSRKQMTLLFVFAIGFSALWIFGILSVSREMRLRSYLSRSAEILEGRIVSNRVSTRVGDFRNRPTSFWVTYSYRVSQPEPREYTRDEEVSADLYRLPVGSAVRVWHLPQNPDLARLADNRYGRSYLLVGMCLMLALGLLLLFAAVRLALRTGQMERLGQVITGSVVESGKKGRSLQISYSFVAPVGTRLQGKQPVTRANLKPEDLPKAGAPVAVLYLNDRTHRML
jgi:hypothetical protein